MGVLRRRKGLAAGISAAIVAVALSAPTLALAASYQAASTNTEETGGEKALTRSNSNGTRDVSPAGCRVRADNPHKSTTPGTKGDIKGHAESHCDDYVGQLGVKASVWRKRWWGYQQMGKVGEGDAYGAKSIDRSGHWKDCEVNNWRTVGYGWSVESGEQYDAEDMNYKDIESCG